VKRGEKGNMDWNAGAIRKRNLGGLKGGIILVPTRKNLNHPRPVVVMLPPATLQLAHCQTDTAAGWKHPALAGIYVSHDPSLQDTPRL